MVVCCFRLLARSRGGGRGRRSCCVAPRPAASPLLLRAAGWLVGVVVVALPAADGCCWRRPLPLLAAPLGWPVAALLLLRRRAPAPRPPQQLYARAAPTAMAVSGSILKFSGTSRNTRLTRSRTASSLRSAAAENEQH